MNRISFNEHIGDFFLKLQMFYTNVAATPIGVLKKFKIALNMIVYLYLECALICANFYNTHNISFNLCSLGLLYFSNFFIITV